MRTMAWILSHSSASEEWLNSLSPRKFKIFFDELKKIIYQKNQSGL